MQLFKVPFSSLFKGTFLMYRALPSLSSALSLKVCASVCSLPLLTFTQYHRMTFASLFSYFTALSALLLPPLWSALGSFHKRFSLPQCLHKGNLPDGFWCVFGEQNSLFWLHFQGAAPIFGAFSSFSTLAFRSAPLTLFLQCFQPLFYTPTSLLCMQAFSALL